MKTIRISLILLLGTLGLLSNAMAAKNQKEFTITYNRYYDYDELTDALKKMQARFSRFMKLESIGKSYQGRDIWLVTINNPATGDEMDKAAMYIDANIHGNEVQGGEVVLYTIDYLMTNYGVIDKVTKLVDERVFYLIPVVNPDGRAHWFDKQRFGSGARSGMIPTDDDNDGLFDEDGYDDIDGDGQILQMRKKVKYGRYRISAVDERILERVPPGEFGDYELLGMEGIDNDGDGRINEDGPGGYDMNRNWPADWQPNYVQRGAGDYPFSFPETRAIGKFILAHPNIAGAQSFHNSGGMILRGPGAKSQEAAYPRDDQMVYDYIGRIGEQILPFYRYFVIYKDLYTVHGGTINWTAEGLGIFSFSNELWSSNQYYNEQPSRQQDNQNRMSRFQRSAERQLRRLQFDDYVEMGARYVEWKPFKHPLYGDIELGGWVRETGRVPPPFMLEELCHRNMAFTLFHADQMPMADIDEVQIDKIGNSTYKIWVTVINKKPIPTISQHAARHHLVRPDILTIEGKNVKVVSAGFVENKWTKQVTPINHRPERVLLKNGIPGNSTITIQFLVSGNGNALIKLDCLKGGKAARSVKLQ